MLFKKPRGIRLERKKISSLLNTLKRPYAPKQVLLPLYGGPAAELTPYFKIGEHVQVGQKIAAPQTADGVPVYASLSGKIEKTATVLLPNGQKCLAVEITGDTDPASSQFVETKKEIEGFTQEDLLGIFQERGLLTTDEKMEPVHVKAKKNATARTVVINCSEPEPYITSGQMLFTLNPIEILKGAELLRKAVGAEKAVMVIEDANREEYELIKSKIYLSKWETIKTKIIPTVYPAGREDFLLKDFQGDVVVWDVATAYAVYEAVYLQKPFYERVVTVAGECIVEPRNLWLPFGFFFQDAIQSCKGFLRDPRKVLAGGPMTGTAQETLDVPVTAGTNAILALPPVVARESHEQPCIRCNRCVDTCPVSLSPAMITIAAEHAEFEIAERRGAMDCVECGVCNYVCPSERPMATLLRLAKEKIRSRR